jgi:hypothetical protein
MSKGENKIKTEKERAFSDSKLDSISLKLVLMFYHNRNVVSSLTMSTKCVISL